MRNVFPAILIAFALAGCSGGQPHWVSIASDIPSCGTGATTGSHIVEKNNCDKGNVSVASGEAFAAALHEASWAPISGH